MIFNLKYLTFLALVVCQLISLIDLTTGQKHANSLSKQTKGKKTGKNVEVKNLGKKIGIRERYYAKNYGKIQFNKYKGRIPSKGSIVDCVVECFSLTTCHCLGINIHNDECHFYGLHSELNLDSSTWNDTFRDHIFFTRDIFSNTDDFSMNKVDISTGRKVTTSVVLDGKSEKQDSEKSSKSSKKAKLLSSSSKFPYPWIQFEFKEPMYITEILLRSMKGAELKKFQIRVGDEPIVKAYSTIGSDGYDSKKDSVQLFEQNSICYQHVTENRNFFAQISSKQRQPLNSKSVRCQPCGLVGKYLTIQTFEPCPSCVVELSDYQNTTASQTITTNKPGKGTGKSSKSSIVESKKQQYPIPIESIEIYGYSTSERKQNTA